MTYGPEPAPGIAHRIGIPAPVTPRDSVPRHRQLFRLVAAGKAATKTRPGRFRVFRSQDRWANSQEFPSARPNMYRPVYFSGGQAFHGMQKDAWVYDRPASHGCVRMLRKDVDSLWAASLAKRGTKFRVSGDW